MYVAGMIPNYKKLETKLFDHSTRKQRRVKGYVFDVMVDGGMFKVVCMMVLINDNREKVWLLWRHTDGLALRKRHLSQPSVFAAAAAAEDDDDDDDDNAALAIVHCRCNSSTLATCSTASSALSV